MIKISIQNCFIQFLIRSYISVTNSEINFVFQSFTILKLLMPRHTYLNIYNKLQNTHKLFVCALRPHKLITRTAYRQVEYFCLFRLSNFRIVQRSVIGEHTSRARTSLKRRNLSSAESVVAFASFRTGGGLGTILSGHTQFRAP